MNIFYLSVTNNAIKLAMSDEIDGLIQKSDNFTDADVT